VSTGQGDRWQPDHRGLDTEEAKPNDHWQWGVCDHCQARHVAGKPKRKPSVCFTNGVWRPLHDEGGTGRADSGAVHPAVNSWYLCVIKSHLEQNPWSLTDHVDGVRRLRTAATSRPTVHAPGDMWAWRAMVMMMPGKENYWLIHPQLSGSPTSRHLEAIRRNGWRSENFAYQKLRYINGSLTCHKILQHGASGFTSHPKEGVLWIFIALKNPLPWPGLNRDPWVWWQAHNSSDLTEPLLTVKIFYNKVK
jgi:hypothetical protein